jgi:hypothetical protein
MAARAGGWLQRGVRPQQCPKLKYNLANQDAPLGQFALPSAS